MDVKTLRSKSANALQKELGEIAERLTELQFKLSSNQLKNVREVRKLKQQRARILTILNEKSQEESSKTE
ncbi:MAG: 50S ribosomal protein L29 [bacterium]|jgi:ribosomal protein L29|nr:50S ribosomal protein L29 [bacterium]